MIFSRAVALTGFLLCAIGTQCNAQSAPPIDNHIEISLWPNKVPNEMPMPGPETVERSKDKQIAGEPMTSVTNIAKPTMTIYAPKGKNTGTAVVVFPGGGFQILAIDLEGTEVCDWLTTNGVTCILLKYRVPSLTYDWQCDCRPDNLAIPRQALDDAQRAIRLARHGASDLHIDPKKIGVLGFSAGGYLVASISTNFERRLYGPIDDADKESARPDFAIALYPGHLVTKDRKLNPNVPVTNKTPPTFLLQAEDDKVDDIANSLTYYAALKKNAVPAEMHLYAQGGHAFGLRQTKLPITGWPRLVDAWLRTIGVIAD
jgi:acetyl esterase/lipase